MAPGGVGWRLLDVVVGQPPPLILAPLFSPGSSSAGSSDGAVTVDLDLRKQRELDTELLATDTADPWIRVSGSSNSMAAAFSGSPRTERPSAATVA